MIYIIGPGPRRSRRRRQCVPRRNLLRGLPEHRTGRGGDEALLHAVFISQVASPAMWHPETPGSHSRGRRTGLHRFARVRGCLRQSRLNTWLVWSVMARRKPARWRRAGTPTSFSIPSLTVWCCPILHLNGYKIANPCVLARISHEELDRFSAATDTRLTLSRAVTGEDAPADGCHTRQRPRRDSPHQG